MRRRPKPTSISFAALQPHADGFRNQAARGLREAAAEWLVDRAQLLTLSAPEMTVLVSGLRVLNANTGRSAHGVLTHRPEELSNDLFVNLLNMGTQWQRMENKAGVPHGLDRATGALKWTATTADLIFGSNAQLRAIAELYASSDGQALFVHDIHCRMGEGDETGPLRPALTGRPLTAHRRRMAQGCTGAVSGLMP